jgi:plasmid stabilization system protein ParE
VRRRIRISSAAAAQIEAAAAWWRKHRDKAPGAFDEDLDAALELIRSEPGSGSRVDARRIQVRRVWLDRIGYFLYYREGDSDIIEVLALWHASRRSRPRF